MTGPGLVFPDDLDAWCRWSDSRNRVRFGLAAVKRLVGHQPSVTPAKLYLPVERPTVLVVLDQP